MSDPMGEYLEDLARRQAHAHQPHPPEAGAGPSPQQSPSTIPYVEAHAGPRRLLVLTLARSSSMLTGKVPPVVGIDGRQYVVVWGTVSFEIPADRAVHVSVHVPGERMTQAASALLPPGDSLSLGYTTDYGSGMGRLG